MIRLLTDDDKKVIFDYLERNELETTFLYANILEFGVENNKEIERCGDYFGFFENEALKGILPFYNLGSCIPHYEVGEAVPLFIGLMKDRNFEYLLGMRKVIKPLFDGLTDFKEVYSYDESSYFINKNLKSFNIDGLTFLDANKIISDEVVEFIQNSRIIGFNQNTTFEETKKSLMQRGDEEDYIIAEKGANMVAQACIQTFTPQINQIGAVYTAGKERGKGYCKAVVSEMCKRIITRGKIPSLSVKKNNTPAVKAYTALGFEHYDDYLIVRYK